MEYGLIGSKLGHSYSKIIHEMLCGYHYDLCPLPTEEEAWAFLTRRQFKAINVTIPYKRLVMEYCTYIDPRAKAIGAVNTVVNKNGLLYGYNTDYLGFAHLCDAHGVDFAGKTVLILGTGGTHNTTSAVARDKGAAKVLTVSRTPDAAKGQLSYEEAVASGAQIVINTKSFDRNGTTITIAMADKKSTTPTAKTVSITLVSGNSTTTQTVEVGKYYSDYAAFNPAAQDGRTPESLKIESNNGTTRFVNVNTKTDNGKILDTDTKVTIQWKAADRQIRFYTDSTLGKIYKTLTVYSGKAIGELPTEVNGKAVEYWTVWGSRIYTTTTYDWTADYVDAVPHFAGETGKVYLEIYVNGNRTSKYAQVDITHKLQDGVIYRDTLLDTIRNATKNNSLKLSSVSYLFNESEWSQYVRNVNNTTTNTKLQIGTDSQNARYVYVMVNGVTTKTTDPSNPKTGDSAKLGVAAAVLAVAVVGFGAVIVINKKKGAI